MKRGDILFILLLITGLQSCIKDSCNADLGNTFNSIELDTIFENENNQAEIHFASETLNDLPDVYFTAYNREDETNLIFYDSTVFSKNSIILYVDSLMIPDTDQYSIINSMHTFSDRKLYISCQHPGSSDQYLLSLQFEIHRPISALTLKKIEWQELFIAGHL